MIKFIPVEDLLMIRNDVLREGRLTPDECRFASDELGETFHLGYYIDDKLVSIASFHPQNLEQFSGSGYQLRGMATIEQYRSRGLGNQLLKFATGYLNGQKINYLWCNARKKALEFYLSAGFEIISAEFDVPEIGLHYVMYVKIQ